MVEGQEDFHKISIEQRAAQFAVLSLHRKKTKRKVQIGRESFELGEHRRLDPPPLLEGKGAHRDPASRAERARAKDPAPSSPTICRQEALPASNEQRRPRRLRTRPAA